MIRRSTELLLALVCEELNSRRFIRFDTDIARGYLGCHHQQFQSYENLISLLHHQSVVGSDIRLALHRIDDHALRLGSGWWRELNKGRESCTAHTSYTSLLHTVDDLLGCQLRMIGQQFQLFGAVDAFFPFIPFHVDDDYRLAVACGIDGRVHLEHRSRYRRVDRSRDKAASLSNQGSHLYFIALGDNGFGRSTDVLRQREDSLLGQRGHLCYCFVGELILLWMNATYTECSAFHAFASSSLGLSTLGLGAGKFTAWMAWVGQASTHFLHKRHLLKSI